MGLLTLPSAGDAATAAWGDLLAVRVNQLIPITCTPNSTTSSTSWSDVPGMTFPVEAGKQYLIRVAGQYSVTAVGNGFVVGYNHPGGGVSSYARFYGNGGPTTALVERVSASPDGGTGITSVDGTSSRQWDMDIVYSCTVSGTFALRWKRPGATNSAITMTSAGGMVVASA